MQTEIKMLFSVTWTAYYSEVVQPEKGNLKNNNRHLKMKYNLLNWY